MMGNYFNPWKPVEVEGEILGKYMTYGKMYIVVLCKIQNSSFEYDFIENRNWQKHNFQTGEKIRFSGMMRVDIMYKHLLSGHVSEYTDEPLSNYETIPEFTFKYVKRQKRLSL